MALSQGLPVVPPLESDKQLIDYSAIIRRGFDTLFQAAHNHVGKNGILTSAPTSNMGNVGDILLAVVSANAYIYFKVNDTDWYRLGPATKV
jgi:hypothetical protein